MSVEHPYYRNIIEYIVLGTIGQLPLADYSMLCILSKFAHWSTGEPFDPDEYPSLDEFARLTQMSRRTVTRILERLERGGWIRGHRRHRKPTLYAICIDQLDRKKKPIEQPLRATDGTLKPPRKDSLRATGDTLNAPLRATSDTLNGFLRATGDTPSLDPNIRSQYKKEPPRIRAEPPTTTPKIPDQEDKLAQRGRLAEVMRAGLSPGRTRSRREARLIAAVLRKLVKTPHRWTDAGDVKEALRNELKRLGIDHGPADFDDAISWLGAAIPHGITTPVQRSA